MSETRVTFRGFESDQEHSRLMDYLSELLGSSLESFLPRENFILDLKVHHESLHNNHNNQRFECEAIVRILGERKPIVVRKAHENFYRAAHSCEQVLRDVLNRRTRVRAQARRQRQRREALPA